LQDRTIRPKIDNHRFAALRYFAVKIDSSTLITAELLSMVLGKVSPNLNNQNDGGNSEQRPADRHRNCIENRALLTLSGLAAIEPR
jgi:hypothetical protein